MSSFVCCMLTLERILGDVEDEKDECEEECVELDDVEDEEDECEEFAELDDVEDGVSLCSKTQSCGAKMAPKLGVGSGLSNKSKGHIFVAFSFFNQHWLFGNHWKKWQASVALHFFWQSSGVAWKGLPSISRSW